MATATLFAGALYATQASAGCGGDSLREPAALQHGAKEAVLTKAAFTGFAPIVGLWSVTFLNGDGSLNDFGYQQWHGDGTEILNSGSHSPATQNFCLGVWKENGPNRYILNHWALSYDPSTITAAPTSPTLKINLKEDVTVGGGGDTFTGAFSEDVYDAKSGALKAHLTGKVTGQRIRVAS